MYLSENQIVTDRALIRAVEDGNLIPWRQEENGTQWYQARRVVHASADTEDRPGLLLDMSGRVREPLSPLEGGVSVCTEDLSTGEMKWRCVAPLPQEQVDVD